MKAKGMGILSTLTASICCLGPLLLLVLGLGGLGIESIFGKYHGYFLLAAAFLLIFAWGMYFQEKRSCQSGQCEVKGRNITRNILILATSVVLAFSGFHLYTFAKSSPVCASCANIFKSPQ